MKVHLKIGLAAALAFSAPSLVFADDLEIRGIMKGLGTRTEEVVRGINTGDFDLIEKSALKIADHDKPSMIERLKILGFLGTKAGDFKSGDEVVHGAASKLAEAAKKKDTEAVIQSFGELMKGCNSCHSKYRGQIVERFYGPERK